MHAEDGSTWALNMRPDKKGMTIVGTPGVEPVAGLAPADEVVTKTRDSAFHDTDLAGRLARHRVDHVVLCGVSTESCIAATATEAYVRDLHVTLVEDATGSVDTQQHA